MIELSESSTDRQSVVSWLSSPDPNRALHFDGSAGSVTFDELALRVAAMASDLTSRRVSSGDRVAILASDILQFVTAFYGVLGVGAAATPLAPPGPFAKRDDYKKFLQSLLHSIQPTAVVVDTPEMASLVEQCADVEHVMAPDRLESGSRSFDDLPGSHVVAVNQMTSGSTGLPRPIPITHGNLSVQCTAMKERIDLRCDDVFVNWLPLHHDMGLVGCLVLPVMLQLDTHLMSPTRFVRSPKRWLTLISENGGTVAAAPGFALDHVTRSVSKASRDLELDLSRWRVFVVGAERVHLESLVNFASALERYGFANETLMPSYGLAEATLGVSVPWRGDTRFVEVAPESLRLGRRVEHSHPQPLFSSGTCRAGERARDEVAPGPTAGANVAQSDRSNESTRRSQSVVACGKPLRNTTVEVWDPSGNPVGDGVVGEIVVSGGSVSNELAFDGRLRTRDAGFVVDGDLYVLGRIDSMLKVHGRALFSEDLEAQLRSVDKAPSRVALVPEFSSGNRFMLVAESRDDGWVDAALSAAVSHCGPDVGIDVYRGRRGSIPFTSSGKPKRLELGELIRSRSDAFTLIRSHDPASLRNCACED